MLVISRAPAHGCFDNLISYDQQHVSRHQGVAAALDLPIWCGVGFGEVVRWGTTDRHPLCLEEIPFVGGIDDRIDRVWHIIHCSLRVTSPSPDIGEGKHAHEGLALGVATPAAGPPGTCRPPGRAAG